MQLEVFSLMVRDGLKIVKLNLMELKQQCHKWESPLIGYVLGGNPTFKEMLKFIYEVWKSVSTLKVFMHDDRYIIFRFDTMEDKATIL